MKNTQEFVYVYTREQAVSDGVLIDISNISLILGLNIPVYLTVKLYDSFIKISQINPKASDNEKKQILHILTHLYGSIMNEGVNLHQKEYILFTCCLASGRFGVSEIVTLKAAASSDKNQTPALIIMMPEEECF